MCHSYLPAQRWPAKKLWRTSLFDLSWPGFPGNRHIAKNMIFGQNVFVVEWSFEAEHTGTFAGRPATGSSVKVPGCSVYEYDPVERKITGGGINVNVTTLLKHIGAA
jgi:hypothetical protein